MNTLQKVSEWQSKCGNNPPDVGTDEYYSKLSDQSKRIREELDELDLAIEQKDILEIVDAVCDLDVTVAGAAFIHGGDHEGAMLEVLANNDLKVTLFEAEAEGWTMADRLLNTRTYICTTYVEGLHWHCVKRCSDNKIMKPSPFPKVDLTAFLPTIPENILRIAAKKRAYIYAADCVLCEVLPEDYDTWPESRLLSFLEENSQKVYEKYDGVGLDRVINGLAKMFQEFNNLEQEK